jgi:hypothetical protein
MHVGKKRQRLGIKLSIFHSGQRIKGEMLLLLCSEQAFSLRPRPHALRSTMMSQEIAGYLHYSKELCRSGLSVLAAKIKRKGTQSSDIARHFSSVPTHSSAQGLIVVPFGPRDDGYTFPSQLQLLFPGPHLRF